MVEGKIVEYLKLNRGILSLDHDLAHYDCINVRNQGSS